MKKSFFIHKDGQQLGPWNQDLILRKIDSKEVEWTDYIYSVDLKDWVYLLDHPDFVDAFKQTYETKTKNPQAKVSHAEKNPQQAEPQQQVTKSDEWYILRDENKYGPFEYLELVRMLQQKKIFDYDFVWNRGKMSIWAQISELQEFTPERIRAVRDSGSMKVNDVFFRRRHKRMKFGASILLHNNKEVWRGNSIEISSGGAGLMIHSGEISLGQKFFLHFQAGDGVPPFNASVEIVSKKPEGSSFRYGVRFTEVSQVIQQSIRRIAEIKGNQKAG